MRKTLFMETTKIEPGKTAGEIMELLAQANARQIAVEYDDKRTICGMAFLILVDGRTLPFRLPARVDPVFSIINGRRKTGRTSHTAIDREQAVRVAWRQLLRWVQAQLAMIETGMVTTHEVFLPYAQDRNGKTLYELLSESKFKMLEAHKD